MSPGEFPESRAWEWLKSVGDAAVLLDRIELGTLVVESLESTQPLRTYPVLVTIAVDAADEDEARLQVERLLAGRFDFTFLDSPREMRDPARG
jgi:hypothetical protein